jgi:hypothetical protein
VAVVLDVAVGCPALMRSNQDQFIRIFGAMVAASARWWACDTSALFAPTTTCVLNVKRRINIPLITPSSSSKSLLDQMLVLNQFIQMSNAMDVASCHW